MIPVVIEDFITQEECDFLIEYSESKEGEVGTYNNEANVFHWGTDRFFEPVEHNPRMHALAKDLAERIGKLFTDNFEMKNTFEFKRMFAQTLNVGGDVPQHTDDHDRYDGKPLVEEHYSALLYLNDDYEGGELEFPNEQLTIKPKPGSLVYFKGDADTRHGVKKVLSGKRINLVVFFRDYIPVD